MKVLVSTVIYKKLKIASTWLVIDPFKELNYVIANRHR